MRSRIASLVGVGCLLVGGAAAPGASAVGPDAVGAASVSPSPESAAGFGWSAYGGARIGMRVPRAARVLDASVRTDPCTPGRWILVRPAGGSVVLAETIRQDGRINEIATSSNRVSGPSGVKPGMRMPQAARRLERDGHGVSYRTIYNEAYDVWVRSAFADGPRGRVLLMRRVDGRVVSISSFADMALARWQMNAPGGC